MMNEHYALIKGEIDYEQDPMIHAAVDSAMREIESEVALLTSSLSFQSRRKKIAKRLYDFKNRFTSGYHVLLDEFREILAAENKEEVPRTPFMIERDMREVLEDKTLCIEKMLAGTALSDIMGFSQEVLAQFYEIAKRFIWKNEMHK